MPPFYCKVGEAEIDWSAVLEALQWTGANWAEMCLFVPVPEVARGEDEPCDEHMDILIRTPAGEMRAHLGDYVVRDRQGAFWPCTSDVFAQTYERFIFERVKVPVMDGGE